MKLTAKEAAKMAKAYNENRRRANPVLHEVMLAVKRYAEFGKYSTRTTVQTRGHDPSLVDEAVIEMRGSGYTVAVTPGPSDQDGIGAVRFDVEWPREEA